MGRLTSFQIITPLERISNFFEQLLSQTTASAHSELLTILATKIAPTDICLSFLIKLDNSTQDLEIQELEQENTYAIGCVWTQFHFGDRYLMTTFTSSYSAMAKTFEESSAIQQKFIDISARSESIALFLIDDWDQTGCLWHNPQYQFLPSGKTANPIDQVCEENINSVTSIWSSDHLTD